MKLSIYFNLLQKDLSSELFYPDSILLRILSQYASIIY